MDLAYKDQLMNDFFLDPEPGSEPAKPAKSGSASAETKSSDKAEPSIPQLFENIKKLISPEVISKVQAVYQFNVTGNSPPCLQVL